MSAASSSRKQGLLLRVERFARRRYGLVFALAAGALLVGVAMMTALDLESDILSLIPRSNVKIDAFRQALADFGSFDLLLVLVESRAPADEEPDPELLYAVADGLARRLEARRDLVSSIEYRLDVEEKFLDLMSENALLFLRPDQLPELAARLRDEAIDARIRDNRLALASPAASLAGTAVADDPLGLVPFFLERSMSQRRALRIDLSDGYYLSRDGRSLIMLVKPRHPSQRLAFNRRLMAALDDDVRHVRAELTAEGEPLPVRVRFGGNYALVLQETELIRRDLAINPIVSLLAVATLYFIAYRRVAALLYSSLPLLVGQALTFVVAYLAIGGLNAVSVAFTALLMGLGTDFTIVMYARYVEERQGGATIAAATERMVGETGLGVFTGAITSAGTFYAMCISRFRGLSELGILIGTGILLCAAAIVFLLPAMITWNEAVRRRKVDSARKLHLQSFGLERLMPFSARHRTAVLVGLAVLTVAGAWAASDLDYDDSLRALRSNRTDAAQVQETVARTFGATLSPMMAIASGRTMEEALERMRTIETRLQPFLERGVIGTVDSILTHLPPPSEQNQIIRAVREGGSAFDPQRVRGSLASALEDHGFRAEAFSGYLERMERFLAPQRPVRVEDLERHGLTQVVERYVHREPGEVRLVSYLFPTEDRWRRRPPEGLIQAVTRGDAGIAVTGSNVAAEELRSMFVRDALRAVAVGLAIVFVLLLVDFRSLRLTLLALAQVVSAVLMMLGLMQVTGVNVNMANAFVATMILGVGIDYGLHLIHRMQHAGGVIGPGTLETGKAVVIAALTNVAGFGTLMLSNYPAMRSFGVVALYGSLCSLLTALTLVPAVLARPGGDRAR